MLFSRYACILLLDVALLHFARIEYRSLVFILTVLFMDDTAVQLRQSGVPMGARPPRYDMSIVVVGCMRQGLQVAGHVGTVLTNGQKVGVPTSRRDRVRTRQFH
jgi:hypothetical protein